MIEQAFLGLFGVTAIWLSQDARYERRKLACIFGLCAQPFWFYATWKAQQWGIFALSIIYALSWLRGFFNYWVYNKKDRSDGI